MFWRGQISEDAGADYLESVGGNKKQVAKPSFLRSFQSKVIERLWKFVKKECLYSKYYSEFKDFKNAIINCLNQTDTTYKEELDSLLTLRFQRFEKAQVVAV